MFSLDVLDPGSLAGLSSRRVLVTGGCGFIGSHLVRSLLLGGHEVLNLDKMTYAANPMSTNDIAKNNRYSHLNVDICDAKEIERIFFSFRPDVVMNLAAESHVDRSIENPDAFIQTNVVGTLHLLKAAHKIWSEQRKVNRSPKFLQISTDEVYGSLEVGDPPFTELSGYDPSSPYSASKAAGDLLALSWAKTFGLPVIVTNCSNNFGPFQYPEKLIPLVITRAITGKSIPIYGTGENIRDWIYVGDHVAALMGILSIERPESRYNIGGHMEVRNIDLVNEICGILDDIVPKGQNSSYRDQIEFVGDRLGHDFRYAIDCSKIMSAIDFKISAWRSKLMETVAWYLNNKQWWHHKEELIIFNQQ